MLGLAKKGSAAHQDIACSTPRPRCLGRRAHPGDECGASARSEKLKSSPGGRKTACRAHVASPPTIAVDTLFSRRQPDRLAPSKPAWSGLSFQCYARTVFTTPITGVRTAATSARRDARSGASVVDFLRLQAEEPAPKQIHALNRSLRPVSTHIATGRASALTAGHSPSSPIASANPCAETSIAIGPSIPGRARQ